MHKRYSTIQVSANRWLANTRPKQRLEASTQTKVTFVMLCMNVQLDCNVSYVIGLNVHCNRQRVSPKFKWCASRQESLCTRASFEFSPKLPNYY